MVLATCARADFPVEPLQRPTRCPKIRHFMAHLFRVRDVRRSAPIKPSTLVWQVGGLTIWLLVCFYGCWSP